MNTPYERMYFVNIANEYDESDTLEIMATSEEEAREYAKEELDDMNHGSLDDRGSYRIVGIQ